MLSSVALKLKPVNVIFGSEIPSEVIRISAGGYLNPEQEERKHTNRLCCLVLCSLAGPQLVEICLTALNSGF